MHKATILFIGFLITFATAWTGLVLLPARHYNAQAAQLPATSSADEALIDRGRQVYQANGCLYCHSQQVSPRHFRRDQERGWGERRTVSSDYLRDKIALLGTMRTGPDLANIGLRNPSASWHSIHLYDPQLTSPGSTMPPFRFLFEPVKDGAVADAFALPDGTRVAPTADARALVAYLLSLKHSQGEPPDAFEPPAK